MLLHAVTSKVAAIVNGFKQLRKLQKLPSKVRYRPQWQRLQAPTKGTISDRRLQAPTKGTRNTTTTLGYYKIFSSTIGESPERQHGCLATDQAKLGGKHHANTSSTTQHGKNSSKRLHNWGPTTLSFWPRSSRISSSISRIVMAARWGLKIGLW
jgi:hypothetical protein